MPAYRTMILGSRNDMTHRVPERKVQSEDTERWVQNSAVSSLSEAATILVLRKSMTIALDCVICGADHCMPVEL